MPTATATPKTDLVQAARAELARRELARRHVVWRLKYLMPDYIIKPVHTYVGEALDQFCHAFIEGKAPRLMIDLPAQHGKSTLVNGAILGLIGHLQNKHFALTSYGSDLAERSSLMIVNWITSTEGRNVYPGVMERRHTRQRLAASEWHTATGNVIMARGVGGPLTGRPVDVMVFDDLIKDYEEYLSAAKRRQLRNWLETVAQTRINNETAIISIGTRWGVDDGADMIEQIIPGGEWYRITIPALAEYDDPLGRKPGEPLFPEKHSLERLLDTRSKIGEPKWAAMYQQHPQDEKGKFFKADQWDVVNLADWPNLHPLIRYWDLAFTRDGHGTAGALCGIKDHHLYIQHIATISHADWPEIKVAIKRQMLRDGPEIIQAGEATGTQVGYFMELQRELAPHGIRIELRRSKEDKAGEAKRWQSIQWSRMVHLLNAPWNMILIDNAKLFPGRDIDMIDAISGAYYILINDPAILIGSMRERRRRPARGEIPPWRRANND